MTTVAADPAGSSALPTSRASSSSGTQPGAAVGALGPAGASAAGRFHTQFIRWHWDAACNEPRPVFALDLAPVAPTSVQDGGSAATAAPAVPPAEASGWRLATAGGDSSVCLWSVGADGAVVHLARLRHQRAVNAVRFAPGSSTLLASADDDGNVLLWQRQTDAVSSVFLRNLLL